MTLHKHAWRLSVKEVLSLLTPLKNRMWECWNYFFSVQVIHKQQFHHSYAHEVKAKSMGIFHLRLQFAQWYLQCWTEGQWLPSTAPQFGRGKSTRYATWTSSRIVCCEQLGTYGWRSHHWAILLPQRLNVYIYPDTSSARSVGLKSSSLSKMTNNGSECDALWRDVTNVFLGNVIDKYNKPLYFLSLHHKQSACQSTPSNWNDI